MNITKPIGLSNIWANGGTKKDPGAAKVNIGWVVQLPPYEYQNWVDNRQDQAIAHISQHGIPEWDSQTEYQGLLSYTQGSNGIIYKCIQTNTNKDPANILNDQYWSQAFETYGAVAVVSAALADHIRNYQTLAGIGNVGTARANLSVYSKTESDTRFASLNGSASQVFSVGVATQPQHAVRLSQVSGLVTQATEADLGVVRLATNGVVESGTDNTTVITPLKAATVYLKKSANLGGLPNVSQARLNLGLGSAATYSITSFLQPGNNLGDIPNKQAARDNLGLTSSATRTEDYFVRTGLNLSDLPSKSASRSNLGLGSAATYNVDSFLQPGYNFGDVPDKGAARNNLGLGQLATFSASQVLQPGNNLGDLTNVQSARNFLGLGSAATKNVAGFSGDFDFSSNVGGSSNWYRLPNGLIHQFGSTTISNNTRVNFPVAMNAASVQLTIANVQIASNLSNRSVGVGNVDSNGFSATSTFGNSIATVAVFWHATGWL
ncbi:tail fiber protein [Pseudomonas phage PHB09]|uniref:Tail fiber protein n=1 Tax=Pseudomonas phage PHB09 TaxID=2867265 RepID=A0AAE9BMP8_9CAUD|nr:tail fiber protein [Pseudomonas phage PHB09]UAV84555.1 tail fiber protein [Pseudomonas phage PHB09]